MVLSCGCRRARPNPHKPPLAGRAHLKENPVNFQDSAEEAQFRRETRTWLARYAPDYAPGPELTERQAHDLGRGWQREKASAGYVGFTLPTALGGRGGTIIEQIIFQTEEAGFDLPTFNSFTESWGVAAPVISRHGTPAQVERFNQATLTGEAVWCQLFSEPSGGSDVASVRTRAERDGDDWIINGQKVWTSDAHLSDWGLLLARTNPDVPKHKGLTVFLLDMKTSGVEVRPIKKISGESEFNEVFFTDVRVSDEFRLGEIDGGWKIAHTTFHEEHSAFSGAPSVIYDVFKPLVRLLQRILDADGRPLIEHAAVRSVLADYYVDYKAVEYTRYRQYTDLAKGGHLGFENTIAKLVLGRWLQKIGRLALDLAGPGGLVTGSTIDPDLAEIQKAFLVGPGLRIGGGTDEIALNNIAERVMGLPGDVRLDKDTPFRDLR